MKETFSVQTFVDRGPEAQVVQKVKSTPGHLGAAQQGVVGAAQRCALHLQDVIGQRPHLGGQVVVTDLGQSFGHEALLHQGGKTPRLQHAQSAARK